MKPNKVNIMNILFLGGGRRVELAKLFKFRGYKIYSYELNKRVPISSIAQIVEGYHWKHEGIYNHIVSIIQNLNIDLVIPLQDEAVLVASKLPEITQVLSPEYEIAEICFDKKLFENFIVSNPDLAKYYPFEVRNSYPKIVKPRYGFGSRNLITIDSPFDEANFFEFNSIINYVVQSKINGIEYSVDSYFDKDSKWIDSIPRQRIRVGSGEVITSLTVEKPNLVEITKFIGELLKLRGPTNTQYIITPEEDIYILEINSRFGGGYTLSIAAGLDTISLIERDYFNKEFDYIPNQWKRNLLLERSYEDHFFQT